jgi:hypothetical protein
MWIPKPLYELIPHAYMGAGAALVAAACFLGRGPRGLLLLFGAAGLTAGLVLWMRRRDYRASQAQYDTRSIDD